MPIRVNTIFDQGQPLGQNDKQLEKVIATNAQMKNE